MASHRQIEANRLNAQKSTGPRSPEGKSRSSMNALKSGIDANSQVIRGELFTDLEALKTEYYGRFHPTTPETRMLVDALIDAEWLLRRFRAVETHLWEHGAKNSLPPISTIVLGQAFIVNCGEFARLQRRVDSAHRNYRNALHELERLQAEQIQAEEAQAEEAQAEEARHPDPEPAAASPRNQSGRPSNGFVPQTAPKGPIGDPPAQPPSLVNSKRDVSS
jgi:hypothetical protein